MNWIACVLGTWAGLVGKLEFSILTQASVRGAVTGRVHEGQLQGNKEGFWKDVGVGVV